MFHQTALTEPIALPDLPETDERLFIDPYLDWTAAQGVPVVEDYGVDVSASDGGVQIEYYDQDPRIHATFLSELAKHGTICTMAPAMFNRP